jgi:hypothetical protein
MRHSDWRPIKTAPTDGTLIFLYEELQNKPHVFVGSWWQGPNWGYFEDNGPEPRGWKPTHWMPLPAPPTEGTE